jgi:MFS family permease
VASVRVRIDDFEDGVYPDVCASSGVAGGARLYGGQATYRPGWVWLLLFGGPPGIVGALVLSAVLRRSVPGYVPYTEATQDTLLRRQARFVQGAVVAGAVLVGSLVVAGLSDASGYRTLSMLGFGAGVVGVLLAVFLWTNVPGAVGTKLESNGRWVVLDPVSARFAAAYEEQEASRRRSRRAATRGLDDVYER